LGCVRWTGFTESIVCGGSFFDGCGFGEAAVGTFMVGRLVFVRAVFVIMLVAGTEAAARGVLFAGGSFVPIPRTFRAQRDMKMVSNGTDSHADF